MRRSQITLHQKIDDITLDVDCVVPIGLIVNELLSNALKYAFPDKRKGSITVSLSEIIDYLVVTVSDDGIGFTMCKQRTFGDSFGYRLINVLKIQLNAELQVDGENGTKVKLIVKKFSKTA